MSKDFSEADQNLLDSLGVDTTPDKLVKRSAREERIIAGFEEILRFAETHGRSPQHGTQRDIFERLYAVRLEQIRASQECRTLIAPLDTRGLLQSADQAAPAGGESENDTPVSDEDLLASLGLDENPSEDDITQLTHVRSQQEIKAAEEIAQRTPCEDFAAFKPVFDQVQQDLDQGERKTIRYRDNAGVSQGDLFILNGQKVLVAELGEPFVGEHGRSDSRLRVIYDNATESDLLLRSLQRALNKDKASRRITTPDLGPLFGGEVTEDDVISGTIYVLRSKSDHAFIAEHRDRIHKVGVTGGPVASRIKGAKGSATYLFDEVEVVAQYQLANIHRWRLETLLKKFFAPAQLNIQITDRSGRPVKPKEWFLVSLEVIEEVIDKIKLGTIDQFRYDPEGAQLVVTQHSS